MVPVRRDWRDGWKALINEVPGGGIEPPMTDFGNVRFFPLIKSKRGMLLNNSIIFS
jgi:hypothetical protein